MRIVYFAVSEREGPSSRYRIHQYRSYFAASAIELFVAPALANGYFRAERRRGWGRWWRRAAWLSAAWMRRLAQLRHLWGADGVIIEREFFPWLPPLFEWLLHRRPLGYVLELDDAIYLSRGRRWKYPRLVRWARAVIVGNEYLAVFCRRYNQHVSVIPTTVSAAHYRPRPRARYARSTMARIGWVGLAYNFPHLHSIAAALAEVCQQGPAKLVVVSARPPILPLPHDFVLWHEHDEAEVISTFDVGIMPLCDTPFARGKCGLKLLQYMACGVPSVASPVGVNSAIIRNGVNGLLATTPSQWSRALLQLLADEELRARLGTAARQTVETDYSLEVWGPRLVDLYAQIVAKS